MTKPRTAPLLDIATRHNVPYADVLAYADWLLHKRSANPKRPIPPLVADEIDAACEQFNAIRAGRIDWQTGEPVQPENEKPTQPCYIYRTSDELGWKPLDWRTLINGNEIAPRNPPRTGAYPEAGLHIDTVGRGGRITCGAFALSSAEEAREAAHLFNQLAEWIADGPSDPLAKYPRLKP